MSEINTNLFVKINNKLKSNKNGYYKLKLDISKIFFWFCSSIYFFAYLCIVSWFMKENMSLILIWIFPLFLFSIFSLLYDTIISVASEKTENIWSLRLILFIILWILYALILAFNYWLKI